MYLGVDKTMKAASLSFSTVFSLFKAEGKYIYWKPLLCLALTEEAVVICKEKALAYT